MSFNHEIFPIKIGNQMCLLSFWCLRMILQNHGLFFQLKIVVCNLCRGEGIKEEKIKVFFLIKLVFIFRFCLVFIFSQTISCRYDAFKIIKIDENHQNYCYSRAIFKYSSLFLIAKCIINSNKTARKMVAELLWDDLRLNCQDLLKDLWTTSISFNDHWSSSSSS